MLFLLQVTVPVGWVRVRYPSFCQALHRYLCLGDIWQLAYITETLRPVKRKKKNKTQNFKLNQQVHRSGSKGKQHKKEKLYFFWNSVKCGLAAVSVAMCGPVSSYPALAI